MARNWVPIFLDALAESPNITAAARSAGITRQAVHARRKSDPRFAASMDDAIEQSTDALVGEMYRRARDGTEKPVFYQGEVCGRVREFSDTLAMFLARAHRPAVYGEKVHQTISGPDGAPLRVEVAYLDDDRDPDHDAAAPPGTTGDPPPGEAI